MVYIHRLNALYEKIVPVKHFHEITNKKNYKMFEFCNIKSLMIKCISLPIALSLLGSGFRKGWRDALHGVGSSQDFRIETNYKGRCTIFIAPMAVDGAGRNMWAVAGCSRICSVDHHASGYRMLCIHSRFMRIHTCLLLDIHGVYFWRVEVSLNVHCGLLDKCGLSTTGLWAVTRLPNPPKPTILPPYDCWSLYRAEQICTVCSSLKSYFYWLLATFLSFFLSFFWCIEVFGSGFQCQQINCRSVTCDVIFTGKKNCKWTFCIEIIARSKPLPCTRLCDWHFSDNCFYA